MAVMGSQVSRASEVPWPPRYWWGKRLGGAFALFVVAVLGLRAGVSWWAERRLEALIRAAQERGEPVFPEDFALPTVPDEENAAYWYRLAQEALHEPNALLDAHGRWVGFEAIFDDPGILTRFPEVADELLAGNALAFEYARRGAQRRRSNWDFQPHAGELVFHLRAHFESVGHTLGMAAYVEVDRGHHAAAVEYAISAVEYARRVDCNRGWEAMTALRALEPVIPRLRTTEECSQQEIGATRARLEMLLRLLADEASYPPILLRAACARRTADLMLLSEFAPEGWGLSRFKKDLYWSREWPWGTYFAASPLYQWMHVRTMEERAVSIRSATLGSFDPDGYLYNWWNFVPNSMFGDFVVSFCPGSVIDSSPSSVCAMVRDARLNAIALAIRLFETDCGRRPEHLDELVPRYLPALPRDPYFADGRAFEYFPNDQSPRLRAGGEGEYRRAYYLNGDPPVRSPLQIQATATTEGDDE